MAVISQAISDLHSLGARNFLVWIIGTDIAAFSFPHASEFNRLLATELIKLSGVSQH